MLMQMKHRKDQPVTKLDLDNAIEELAGISSRALEKTFDPLHN